MEPNSGGSVGNLTFNNCQFLNNQGGGVQIGPSISDGPSPLGNGSATCSNLTFNNCVSNGNGGSGYNYGGFRCVASSNVKISNCTIANNLNDGIDLYYLATSYTVSGCTITGNSGYGVTAGEGAGISGEDTGCVISGNTITGNSAGAIENYSSADGASFSSNTTN
jgi:parallel beta-helix repeat protein